MIHVRLCGIGRILPENREERVEMEKEINILLTSAGRRSYLVDYFKTALSGRGLVHAANSQESPALYAADRHVETPLIYDGAYIPFLLDYCKANRISMVIPLFDVDLPVLAAHRAEFEAAGVRAVVSDPETVEICNDKWKTYQFLRENGFPAPKTYLSLAEAEAAALSGELSFPVMVKPRWGMGSLSIYEAETMEELRIFYRKSLRGIRSSYLHYESGQDWGACVLIQEKLSGQEYGMDVINDLDGNCCAAAIKRKEAMRSGETDRAVTVENADLSRLGQAVSRLLRHRGNLDMDVFESGGRYYILEMNARFGGGYPFSHAAGADLPGALVDWAAGRPVEAERLRVRPGVRSYKDIRICTEGESLPRAVPAEERA